MTDIIFDKDGAFLDYLESLAWNAWQQGQITQTLWAGIGQAIADVRADLDINE